MNAFFTMITAGIGFAADRKLKSLIETNPSTTQVREYLRGNIRIKKTTNKGFAMNRCDSNRKLVVTVSVIAFLLVVFLFVLALFKPEYRRKRFAAALLLAGAAGNFYDRLKMGYVVDYINIRPLKKIIFNLADILIVVGSLLYVIL